MRKTFKLFCAAALAALAVSSCGKIWDEFDNVHGEIDGLEARIAELETKLNDQVATINTTLGNLAKADEKLAADIAALVKDVDAAEALLAKLDAADGTINGKIDDLAKALAEFETENEKALAEIVAKIAVVKVEKNKAGNVVLTFADGSTLEVAAADPNANNAGLVTVVDGKWAVVGADGKTTVLDAEVHPDTKIDFKVDPETKALLYTLDGKNWETTGAYVGEEDFYLVTDFVDCDTYVKITVGGVEYELPKVSTNRFEILSGMVFFEAGATKSIPVLLDGVVSSMVAKVPAGWTAEISEGALQVTAPADETAGGDDYMDDDMGGGIMPWSTGVDGVTATYGTIEIWAVTESGKTFVGTLEVSMSDAFATLTVKSDSVFVTIPSEKVFDYDEDWNPVPTGEYEPIYYPVFYGACEADKFDGSTLREIMNDWVVGEDDARYPNIHGNYTIDEDGYPTWLAETKSSLKDLLGAEPEVGKTYVVWAFDREAFEYDNSDATFVKAYYTPSKVTFAEPVVSWNDAQIEVSIDGLDEFGVVLLAKDMYDSYTSEDMMGEWTDAGLEMYGGRFTFYDMFMPGLMHYCPGGIYEGSYVGPISKLGYEADSEEVNEFAPGEELVLCVLPIDPAKPKAAYSLADVIVKEFALDGLTYNGTATVAFGAPEALYTSFTLPMSSTSASIVAYKYWTTEAYEALVESLVDGETIQDYMMDNFDDLTQTKEAEMDVYVQNLSKNTAYTVAAIAVDADGKVSQVVTKEVTTKDYPYDNTNLKVEVVSATFTDGKAPVTVVYKVTGAKNIVVNASFGTPTLRNNEKGAATLEGYLMNNGPEYYYLMSYPVSEDGTVSVTYKSYTSSNKYSYAIAYTLDEDDEVSALTAANVVDLSTYLSAE